MTDETFLETETPAPGVRLFRLVRHAKRNALTIPMVVALADALVAADTDPTVGCVVVTGGARAFSAGSDIAEQDARGTDHVFSARRLDAWERMARLEKPSVAAVNGYALGGGCELMLLFDMAVAGEDAVFGFPEITLGVFPGDGGTQRLTRRIGRAAAMRLIFTGERISARRALELGLVGEVVPADDAVAAAVALAASIASRSPLALRLAKDAIVRGEEMSLEHGLALERRNLETVCEGPDWRLGMKSFAEKRALPTYSRRGGA